MVGNLNISRGIIKVKKILNFAKILSGFANNMRGVELDTVIHISIQFWQEPWPYGMQNEKSEIRSIKP